MSISKYIRHRNPSPYKVDDILGNRGLNDECLADYDNYSGLFEKINNILLAK